MILHWKIAGCGVFYGNMEWQLAPVTITFLSGTFDVSFRECKRPRGLFPLRGILSTGPFFNIPWRIHGIEILIPHEWLTLMVQVGQKCPPHTLDPMGLGSVWWIGVRCFSSSKTFPFLCLGWTVGLSFICGLRRSLKWLPGSPKIVAQLNGKLFGMEGFLCGLWVSWLGYGPTKGGKLCGKEWRLHEVCQ